MISLKVKILKKIFVSNESGFSVFKTTINKHPESPQIIVGDLFDVNEGDFLEIEGEYSFHPKFGKQIKVKSFKFILPQDKDGIIKYLASGRIKGIGEKTATKIVNKFGLLTFDVLEKDPEKLKKIKGIRKGVIEEIKKNREENRTIRELTVKLSPYGIGAQTIFKIFKKFEENSIEILKHNPYVLIEKIKGVGFKIADTIARGFNISSNNPNRINAGIDFIISQYEQKNGDLYVNENTLLKESSQILHVPVNFIIDSINKKIERNELRREEIPEKVIMSLKNYSIEKMSAKYLYELGLPSASQDISEINFKQIYKKLSINLTEEQKNAAISSIKNNITIISGGPGTGKTTLIRAIIELFIEKNQKVLIAAPTGRAAKRIEETSNFKASTIHRMLKINPETRTFVHNEYNPLQANVIIIDESSMIDSFIFYSLLKAIARNTKLIIIGDKDQLPSVGPGNILRDIINSKYFNTIYLNRNFRQTEESLIIENAYRINKGEQLIFKPFSENPDFVFINVRNENRALEKVLNIMKFYKNDFDFNSPLFQILVPMYRGEAGIDNINRTIQTEFNLEPFLIKKEKKSFKKFDKVMQLKNNYEKEIFNGDQGIIVDFNIEKKSMLVDFEGRIIEYNIDEIDELNLSYAISVHKSQGSEYEMTVLILLPTHSIMLNREIFYTAVTRAKKKIFVISDKNTIQRAIFNSRPSQRKTMLPIRLKEFFKAK